MNYLSVLLSSGSNISEYKVLALVGVIITLGLVFGKLVEKIKLPCITGYLIAGLLIGLISKAHFMEVLIESEKVLGILTNLGLGFIAFSVGSELWFPKFKKSGKEVVVITAIQAIITTFVVVVAVVLLNQELWVGLILGAIATATAPGPIMALTKKYKSKGELTNTLLPLVGLDDVFGIIIFGILLSIAGALKLSTGNIDIIEILLEPGREILFSMLIGVALGLALAVVVNHINKKEEDTILDISLIAIIISVSVAQIYHLSPILLPLAMGTAFTNMVDKPTFKTEERVLDHFTPPIMISFFTIAGVQLGSQLEMELLKSIAVVGTVYLLVRTFGKIFGAYLGALVMKSSKNVKKYLGPCLLPQAGVAIGMALAVSTNPTFQDATIAGGMNGEKIKTIILISTLVFGIIGPVIVKMALINTGEADEDLL